MKILEMFERVWERAQVACWIWYDTLHIFTTYINITREFDDVGKKGIKNYQIKLSSNLSTTAYKTSSPPSPDQYSSSWWEVGGNWWAT